MATFSGDEHPFARDSRYRIRDALTHLKESSTDSSTRNELIAATLFRSGNIESSGMGMSKIRELCDEAGVRVTYEEIPFSTKLTPTAGTPSRAIANPRCTIVRKSSQ